MTKKNLNLKIDMNHIEILNAEKECLRSLLIDLDTVHTTLSRSKDRGIKDICKGIDIAIEEVLARKETIEKAIHVNEG